MIATFLPDPCPSKARCATQACWQPLLLDPLRKGCVRNFQVPAIRALVALGCSVSVTDSVLSTPIHVAAGEGHIEALLALRELVSTPAKDER